jgi:hypothetical protein
LSLEFAVSREAIENKRIGRNVEKACLALRPPRRRSKLSYTLAESPHSIKTIVPLRSPNHLPAAMMIQLNQEQPAAEEEGSVVVIRTTEKQLKEAEKKIATEISNLYRVPKSLGRFSMMAGIFQFIQAIALFIVAFNHEKVWHVYTFYGAPFYIITNPGYAPEPVLIGSINIYWYAPVFILLSGFEHFSCVFFRETYIWFIERNRSALSICSSHLTMRKDSAKKLLSVPNEQNNTKFLLVDLHLALRTPLSVSKSNQHRMIKHSIISLRMNIYLRCQRFRVIIATLSL